MDIPKLSFLTMHQLHKLWLGAKFEDVEYGGEIEANRRTWRVLATGDKSGEVTFHCTQVYSFHTHPTCCLGDDKIFLCDMLSPPSATDLLYPWSPHYLSHRIVEAEYVCTELGIWGHAKHPKSPETLSMEELHALFIYFQLLKILFLEPGRDRSVFLDNPTIHNSEGELTSMWVKYAQTVDAYRMLADSRADPDFIVHIDRNLKRVAEGTYGLIDPVKTSLQFLIDHAACIHGRQFIVAKYWSYCEIPALKRVYRMSK